MLQYHQYFKRVKRMSGKELIKQSWRKTKEILIFLVIIGFVLALVWSALEDHRDRQSCQENYGWHNEACLRIQFDTLTPKKSMNQPEQRSELRNFKTEEQKIERAFALLRETVKTIGENKDNLKRLLLLIDDLNQVYDFIRRVEPEYITFEDLKRLTLFEKEYLFYHRLVRRWLKALGYRSELRAEETKEKEDVLDIAENLLRYVEAESLRHNQDEPTLTQLLQKLDQASELIKSVDLKTAGILITNRIVQLERDYRNQFFVVSGYIAALEHGKKERETTGRFA